MSQIEPTEVSSKYLLLLLVYANDRTGTIHFQVNVHVMQCTHILLVWKRGLPAPPRKKFLYCPVKISILFNVYVFGSALPLDHPDFLLSVLNISTSIQLSMRLDDAASECMMGEAVEVVPYFNNVHLAVVAGLNGGNVLTSLVSLVKHWLQELGELGCLWDCGKELITFLWRCSRVCVHQ